MEAMNTDTATNIEVLCALWQTGMATASLGAAWWIAHDQRRRAERAEQKARIDFVETVLALAKEAIDSTEAALSTLDGMEGPQSANGVMRPWRSRMVRIHETIDLVRKTAPADAKLALAVADLSAAAAPWDGTMMLAWSVHNAKSQTPGKLDALKSARSGIVAFLPPRWPARESLDTAPRLQVAPAGSEPDAGPTVAAS